MINKYTLLIFSLLITTNSFCQPVGKRPDIMTFTASKRSELNGLIQDYVMDDSYAKVNEHICGALPPYVVHPPPPVGPPFIPPYDESPQEIHNYTDYFLTWHRGYIGDLESWLEQKGEDEFVPLPRWDPRNSIPVEFTGIGAGFILPIPVLPKMECHPNPPLFQASMSTLASMFPINYTPNVGSMFPYNFDIYFQTPTMCIPAYNNLDAFADDLESQHDNVHGSVGGPMAVHFSPQTSIFWLWHAWVDDVFLDYERQCQCQGDYALDKPIYTYTTQPSTFSGPPVKEVTFKSNGTIRLHKDFHVKSGTKVIIKSCTRIRGRARKKIEKGAMVQYRTRKHCEGCDGSDPCPGDCQ